MSDIDRCKAAILAIVTHLSDERSRKLRMPLTLRRPEHVRQILGIDLAKWLEVEG